MYDLVLQAMGRSPNGKKIAVGKAGVNDTDRCPTAPEPRAIIIAAFMPP